ncbi:MAG: hypothetical protein QOF01_1102 [Thermomicrobiales bacterium]|nr:hypothetical protein [Thermomicrobiales bacterium]
MRPAPDHLSPKPGRAPDRRSPISNPSPARGGRRQRARPSAIAENREPSTALIPALAETPTTDLVWRRIDLHLHTPASADYQQADVSFLDILQKAEERGLDLIAFTDHNSVRGYADLWREIEDLELLEYLGRLRENEAGRLSEYRRLLSSIVLLPGFEFTATFGFHILAIFPETTSVRKMEHLLMTLGVAEDKFGRGEVGATTDVLAAYRLLAQNGALVIGAHVNSANGVAMQGLRFGGQTKIAYTQDEHLHALEVTDFETPANRRSTARFFSGVKAEYPRRMHVIQGSDAHRLDHDPLRPSNLGIGERATEVLVSTPSFQALRALFAGSDFDRIRAARPLPGQGDQVKLAREEGNSTTQAFHEHLTTKRTGATNVLRDLVALANSGGGTIFVGASAAERRTIAGVGDPAAVQQQLLDEVVKQIAPQPPFEIETLYSDGKPVLAVRVSEGAEKPYALAPGAIFVRAEGESALASRDQIVAMVHSSVEQGAVAASPLKEPEPVREMPDDVDGHRQRRSPRHRGGRSTASAATTAISAPSGGTDASTTAPLLTTTAGATPRLGPNGATENAPVQRRDPTDAAPQTGVEIVSVRKEDGTVSYTMRDLRTSEDTDGVTREAARGLWRYAIEQREEKSVEEGHIRWKGDRGFWKTYRASGGEPRYNLAYRGDGQLRIFYGVTIEGMDAEWRAVLPHRQTAEV